MLTHLVCLKTYFCVSGGHISEIQGAFQVVIQPLTQNVSAQPDSHIGAGRTMQTNAWGTKAQGAPGCYICQKEVMDPLRWWTQCFI